MKNRDHETRVLTRGEGLAAWRQIADRLGADIQSGRLAAGAQLPTEAALSARFDVNRHTVRRALAALAEQGLVRATQGRGTFVEAGPIHYPIGRRTRFSENVSRAGREAWGTLIAAAPRVADAAIADALRLAPGAPVLELLTVHRADDVPISTARTVLPLPRFHEYDRVYAELGSITRAYQRFGVDDYSRLSTQIGARLALADEVARLDLPPGRVLMVVRGINIDADAIPIQSTESLFAADRVDFHLET